MNKDYEMKHQVQDLKLYMVKKFIIILVFMTAGERIVNLFFTKVIFPFLTNFFEKNQIHIEYNEDGMFLGVVIYLLVIIVECIIEILPGVISIPLSLVFHKITMDALKIDSDIFRFDESMPALFALFIRVALFAFMIVLLLLALMPYILAVMCFGVMMSKKAEEQVHELEKQRNLLLADIAHDLKTPLTTVTGYAQALIDNVEEDEEKKKQYLHNIYAKSIRMNEMLTLLFEYLKLESEGFTLVQKQENICEVLRENVALLYMDFEEKGIELIVDIPEKKIITYIDRLQISRAISNVLTNMLKHNETGRTVLVTLKQKEDVEIHIADNGEQIKKETADHIFEPFAMGDKSRNSKNGSGLGLSIASKILLMHGGSIILNRHSTEQFTKEFIIYL